MKDFIPYEEALVLKELGFDEECLDGYNKYGKLWGMRFDNQSTVNDACSAPLFSQAFRFFREKYDLDYSLLPESSSGYKLLDRTYNIVIYKYYVNMNVQAEIVRIDGKIARYNKREEAELACLGKLIEIVKQK